MYDLNHGNYNSNSNSNINSISRINRSSIQQLPNNNSKIISYKTNLIDYLDTENSNHVDTNIQKIKKLNVDLSDSDDDN